MSGSAGVDVAAGSVTARLLPFAVAVFLGFLAIGVPLPVLPVQVAALGFGPAVVGAVVGVQSLATLLTRAPAGRLCDRHGPKPVALGGFAVAACAGLFYAASTVASGAGAALALLVAGRLVLGLGESLFITGCAAWSIGRVGAAHAGRAMAWQGMAMYAALAVGAPLGGVVEAAGGFGAVSAAAVVSPLLGLLSLAALPGIAAAPGRKLSFVRVLGAIWVPGLALALASAGFGTIAAFLALRFGAEGWPRPGLALTGFGAAYILMRLLFGHLPDRLGSRRVALPSLLGEAAGQVLLWRAASAPQAFIGAAATGLGYSLVFPALGVAAMRRVAPADRGLALAAYLACFDLGLGAAGPLAGLVVAGFGLPAAFAAAAGAALVSAVLVLGMRPAGDGA